MTRVLEETPYLRWFSPQNFNCRMCGKRAAGTLMSVRNEDYGLHCQKCADKRLAASKRVREQLAKEYASLPEEPR